MREMESQRTRAKGKVRLRFYTIGNCWYTDSCRVAIGLFVCDAGISVQHSNWIDITRSLMVILLIDRIRDRLQFG